MQTSQGLTVGLAVNQNNWAIVLYLDILIQLKRKANEQGTVQTRNKTLHKIYYSYFSTIFSSSFEKTECKNLKGANMLQHVLGTHFNKPKNINQNWIYNKGLQL